MARPNGTYTIKQVNELLKEQLDLAHPKHSYFQTSDASFNPNEKFIGTWVLLDEGTILMSSKENKSSNTNEFVVTNNNIQETKTHGNSGHSHTTTINKGRENGYNHYTIYLGNTVDGQESYASSNENSHEHKIGNSSPTPIKLADIVKHPECYTWYRTA